MRVIGAANLGLRFALEIAMLAAFGYWGFVSGRTTATSLLLGIGAPVAAMVIWGAYIAPKATRRLADPGRLAIEILLFSLAGIALATAGREALATTLVLLAAGNVWLLIRLGQR